MQMFLRSASHDLMMKSREQQTPTPERRREHTASILESNQTGEDCDLFVTFILSVTYRRVSELFLSPGLSSFFKPFFRKKKSVSFLCLYHQNRALPA